MRRVKGWTSSTIVLGLVLAGLAVAPSASAVPDDVPVVSSGAAGGAAKMTGAAYALTVAKSARKSAAAKLGKLPQISKAGRSTVYLPSKDARWFAGFEATGRELAWPDGARAGTGRSDGATVFSAALRTDLKRRGFARVFAKPERSFWIYRSTTYVCQVEGPAIRCVTRAAGTKTLALASQLYKALPSAERYKDMSISVDGKPRSGATKGYLRLTAYLLGPGEYSGAVGLFYKAPRGRWTFATAGQEASECAVFEKSRGARKAYAGEYCYRDGAESTVRR